MKEFTSTVTVEWSANNHYAVDKQDYINKVKEQYRECYGISLNDSEIQINP